MAHNPTSRRKLATPDPEPIPKPNVKRQLHPSTTAPSTVYNLTNHFSRLKPIPNPNPQFEKSQKYPPPSKLIDTRLQTRALSKSATFEPSHTSSAQKVLKQGRRVVLESGKEVKKVVAKDGTKSAQDEEEATSKNEVVGMKVMRPKKEIVSGGGVGTIRRSSFCDAQMELSNFLVTNCAKVVAADMPPFIQIHAVGFARKTKDSLEKFTSKNLALSLKKEFDGVYGLAWHCIVGTSFGSFVTHSVGGFLYFSLDQKLYVLLFKTSVQRADSS